MNKYIETLPDHLKKKLEIIQTDANQQKNLIRHGGYISPNNELLYDALVALLMGKNILLKGPTGSGKTKLAETLSSILTQAMYSVNCSVDLDAESLVGFKTLAYEDDKQVIEFVPGPVTNAMEEGTLLYIDEINMAKPETLPLINGVLDYRRTITNPFTNEMITAKKHFNVIAAINEGYIGTVPLNEALKNRFIVIDVPYIQGDQLYDVIKQETALRDDKQIQSFIEFSADLIAAVSQGKLPEEAASIRALLDACDLSTAISIDRAILRAIAHKLSEQREQQLVMNIAATFFSF